MRSRRAAVLVAVLLGTTALLALGTATLAAAALQFAGAAWTARSERARAAASGAVQVAGAVLARTASRDGAMPAAAPSLPAGLDGTLTIVTYRRIGPREAEIEIRAEAGGAIATVGARLRAP